MDARFDLTAVAFVRTVGGRVRVLLCIDRDGEPMFDGEPALLAEHRPGEPSERLLLEGADRIPEDAVELVRASAHAALAELVQQAFDETGAFDGQRLLGRAVQVRAAGNSFDDR